MADKIDSLTLPNSGGTTTTYDIDLPADAAPSIASLTTSGSVTAGSIIKSGGTSSQFLKADGSVDSTNYANQNAFSYVAAGTANIAADSTMDTLTINGSNVTITGDATNDTVTIGITKQNVVSALGYTPVDPGSNSYVTGPSSATSGNIALFDGTTGKIIKDSGIYATLTDNKALIYRMNYDLLLSGGPGYGSSLATRVSSGIGGLEFTPSSNSHNAYLGTSTYKWTDLYLSGNLSDGTNSTTIANIVTKDTTQTISGAKTFSNQTDFVSRVNIWGDAHISTLKNGEGNYGLVVPATTSYTANKTIATTSDLPQVRRFI